MNLLKDDTINISLPSSDLIFTQYIYIKDEVRIALLLSILNKSNSAIFWAYELYYSGFKHELFSLIWKIYYDFFATLNPSYEAYLLKTHKQFISSLEPDHCIVSSIIQDLLFRPLNTDIFMLRNICENFEIDIVFHNTTEKITDTETAICNFKQWIINNDFRSIAQWILNMNKCISAIDIYAICLDIFCQEGIIPVNHKGKMKKDFITVTKFNNNINIILLAKIMQMFSKKVGLKKGRSVYINVEPNDISQFSPMIGSNKCRPYRILEASCIHEINESKLLSLFKLTRNKYNIQEKYWYNWEYHAAFSPIWSKRIHQYGGYPDYTKQRIIFKEVPDDVLMQQFYSLYGLEPDEQKKETQNKSIQIIEKVYDWKWFQLEYKKNGIFEVYDEELDEFDVDGLKY